MRWYSNNNSIRNCPENINLEIKVRKSLLSYKKVFNVEDLELTKNITYKQLTRYQTKTAYINGINTPLLRPTLQVQYFRDYYIINSEVRITLDHDIKFFNVIGNDKPNEVDCNIFDQSVLEIKFDPSSFSHVSDILKNLKQSPVRNSKYLRGLSSFGYIKYL